MKKTVLFLIVAFTILGRCGFAQDYEPPKFATDKAIAAIKANYLFMYFRCPEDTILTINRFIDNINKAVPVDKEKRDKIKELILSEIKQTEQSKTVSDELDSRWYQSKWGNDCLVKHHPNDVPSGYQPLMTKKYYIKTPQLTGLHYVCPNNTYSITGTVAGLITNTVWSCSPELTLSSQSLLSVNASPTTPIPLFSPVYPLPAISAPYGSINATITVNNVPVAINKTVTVGNYPGDIFGPFNVSGHGIYEVMPTQAGNYRFIANVPSTATYIRWLIVSDDPNHAYTNMYEGDIVTIYLREGYNAIRMQYVDDCGNSIPAVRTIYIEYGGGGDLLNNYIAYPNPASTELTIDKIENANISLATSNEEQSKAKAIKVMLYSHSTARLIYSQNYTSSTQQIKIDTSKLPNGTYYLNIIENGEKVKEQTIIVSH